MLHSGADKRLRGHANMFGGGNQVRLVRFQKDQDSGEGGGFGNIMAQNVRGQPGERQHPRGAICVGQDPAQSPQSEHRRVGLNLACAFRICFEHGFRLSESGGAA